MPACLALLYVSVSVRTSSLQLLVAFSMAPIRAACSPTLVWYIAFENLYVDKIRQKVGQQSLVGRLKQVVQLFAVARRGRFRLDGKQLDHRGYLFHHVDEVAVDKVNLVTLAPFEQPDDIASNGHRIVISRPVEKPREALSDVVLSAPEVITAFSAGRSDRGLNAFGRFLTDESLGQNDQVVVENCRKDLYRPSRAQFRFS